MDVFVARQPIFDRKRQLYAYELLYRSDATRNEFDGTDSAVATRHVISSTLLSIGLENVLCGKKAFLNFDHRLLRDGMHLSLPRQAIVIEILETVQPTADLIALCRTIHDQGYSIALDDFVSQPQFEPLTQIANLIKVDFQATKKEEQERMLGIFRPRGIMMLAEKVETNEEFEWGAPRRIRFVSGLLLRATGHRGRTADPGGPGYLPASAPRDAARRARFSTFGGPDSGGRGPHV